MQLGLPAILTIIFVIAKILGYITWSWLWVLSPLWISAILGLLFLLLFAAVAFTVNR